MRSVIHSFQVLVDVAGETLRHPRLRIAFWEKVGHTQLTIVTLLICILFVLHLYPSLHSPQGEQGGLYMLLQSVLKRYLYMYVHV